MANNWYPVSDLVGGTDGCLDYIDGDDLNNGDRAIAIVGDYAAFYALDSTSGAAESSPDIIAPDTNPGTKRWFLKKAIPYTPFYAEGDISGAAENTVSGAMSYAFGDGNVINGDDVGAGDDLPNVIINGVGNEIEKFGYGNNLIGIGERNKIIGANDAVILAGTDNVIEIHDTEADSIWWSSILSGSENAIRTSGGESVTVLCGCNNYILGEYNYSSAILGGYDNIIVNGNYGCILSGVSGVVTLAGQVVVSNGRFEDNWEYSQTSQLLSNATTTDAAETEMYLAEDDSDYRMFLMQPHTWKFDISVAARQTAGSAGTVGDSAIWSISGCLKNTGGAVAQGSVTFSGVPVADETITINAVTYTWKATASGPLEITLGTDADECALNLETAVTKRQNDIEYAWRESGSANVLKMQALPNTGWAPNSWTFSETCTNVTMDGSGTFGGLTAGSGGTISIVGTPQGEGTPASTDRDTAAAAWSIDVSADNTSKVLKLAVTGEANKTIHWLAKINLVEVG